MLRKMCKKCAPKGSVNYEVRKLTGEVTDVEIYHPISLYAPHPVRRIIKTVTCTECGHSWTFSRTHYYES